MVPHSLFTDTFSVSEPSCLTYSKNLTIGIKFSKKKFQGSLYSFINSIFFSVNPIEDTVGFAL